MRKIKIQVSTFDISREKINAICFLEGRIVLEDSLILTCTNLNALTQLDFYHENSALEACTKVVSISDHSFLRYGKIVLSSLRPYGIDAGFPVLSRSNLQTGEKPPLQCKNCGETCNFQPSVNIATFWIVEWAKIYDLKNIVLKEILKLSRCFKVESCADRNIHVTFWSSESFMRRRREIGCLCFHCFQRLI